MKIILASSSENRKNLLQKMNFQFSIAPPNFAENWNEKISAAENVQNLARGKAKSVFPQFENEKNFLIFGFDSVAILGEKIFGKPRTKKAAFEMIQNLRGENHEIFSGISAIGKIDGKFFEKTDFEKTKIKFKNNFTNCQIRKYLEFDDWRGKCGAYSILGAGIFFVEKIDGDFQNIVGVPIFKFSAIISAATQKFPLKILQPKNLAKK